MNLTVMPEKMHDMQTHCLQQWAGEEMVLSK